MLYGSFHVIRNGFLPQIAEVRIVNDGTGDEFIGNYDVCYQEGERMLQCRVENHSRLQPVEKLIAKAMTQLVKEGE